MDRWKADFPIPHEEDRYVTRRELARFLGLTSLAFFCGTAAAAGRKWWKRVAGTPARPAAVARVDEIPVGGYKLFRDAETDEPCIVVRLDAESFSAFNQSCTHLSCPVYFNAAEKQLVCPCHHGYFSAEDGSVLAGPPRRGLTRLAVAIRDAQVWTRSTERDT